MGLNIKERAGLCPRSAGRRRNRPISDAAIEAALTDYLAQLEARSDAEQHARRERHKKLADLMARSDKILAALPAPTMTVDDLYDDRGLPA